MHAGRGGVDAAVERDGAGVQGLSQQAVGELEQEPEDGGANDGGEDPARPSQDEHGVGEEGEDRDEGVGVDRLGVDGQQRPGQRPDDPPEHQALDLVGEHVLAQGAGGVFVLADRPQDPAPGAAHQSGQEQERHRHRGPAGQDHPQLALAEVERAEPVAAYGDRVDVVELVGESLDAEHASGEPFGGVAAGHQAQYLGSGDGHDGQVVGPQAKGGDAQQQAQQGSSAHPHQETQPQRPTLVDGDRRSVGAQHHEGHVPEVEQPRVPELHVEAHCGEGVGGGGHTDGGTQRIGEDLHQVHAAPPKARGVTRCAPSARIGLAGGPAGRG